MNTMHEEVELEKSVRRLREKFHGLIDIDRAVLLMRRYMNDHQMVAKWVALMANADRDLDDEERRTLKNDPVVKNVVTKLKADERQQEENPTKTSGSSATSSSAKPNSKKRTNEDKHLVELGERLRVLPLTMENKRMFDQAQENEIPATTHQFACQSCDRDWWRRVPQRKRVSRCRRCKKKYDPVPPDKMWGIAEFHCPNCARSFMGFGRMDGRSPCYGCRSAIFPTRILPPKRRVMSGARRKNQHSCLAEDCFNRMEPHVPGTECVHPRSRQKNRKPRVVYPSPAHISSGSTVNTCLSQGSLLESINELILDDIEEESDEESDISS
ncbi:shiftless antiviral inhibitor of ribosomal frameshifting protein homolog [Triplophysa dalaica]|uniref:shiftless antiviral inhibitor of ribosomal frameshifting protein homolog n=1 Tax=Triplophysa dalaica TaxID=1582913 RepID=UPI0024E03B4B|nr:shiftless antiviral inhibitor of ribosomal frameshifting protein homolog [Triplophysa dalaica]